MNTIKTLVYMGVMHGLFTVYLPWRLAVWDGPKFDAGPLRFLAVPLWAAGTLVILWCSAEVIRRGRGTPAHLDPPRQLVVTGPYRHVRNPIYGAAMLVQFGYILWFGSGVVIAYAMAFLLAFHILIVLIEEPILRQTFGAAYDEYCKFVPRWIPRTLQE
jgi:protein-S-isoprenylcysteine O-methyltransferase Ste14